MRALVTGAAGFIGSHLVDRLLADGHEVVGVDCFTPYYDPNIKRENLARALDFDGFTFRSLDLSTHPIDEILEGITHIFHQAGQPGVRASWGEDFDDYVRFNVVATHRLLEAARKCDSLLSFVAASSSSVYGDAERFPTPETVVPAPISPYGVTKLAAENLCSLYGTQYGLPTVSLRYFTVYGPRQRPDMAIHRLITSVLEGNSFVLMGNGHQTRDFTYVDDAVEANLSAARYADHHPGGEYFNVGGGRSVELLHVIRDVGDALGRRPLISVSLDAIGDPTSTCADPKKALLHLDWRTQVPFEEGIQRTVASWSVS